MNRSLELFQTHLHSLFSVFVCVNVQSRDMSWIICVLLPGFGFLTFELEDSVNRVVNERFIQISGKQVVFLGGRELL